MKLSNSKRQLAEIIRASGGEWVEEYVVAAQDGNGRIYVHIVDCLQGWNNNLNAWGASSARHYAYIATGEPIAQCHCTKLTRDEYIAYMEEFETPVIVNDFLAAIAESTSIPVSRLTNQSGPTPSTLEELITDWQEAKCTADHARSELAQLEQAERDAHAAVESALIDAGWGDVPESEPVEMSQDPSTWEVGDKFEVVESVGHVVKGERLTLIRKLNSRDNLDVYETIGGWRVYMCPDYLRKL